MLKVVTREEVVIETRKWLGTPFHHQASLRGVGCDCIGLIVGVAGALYLPEAEAFRRDQTFAGYARLPDPERLRRACKLYLNEINIKDARSGDILLMTLAILPMHFAVISKDQPWQMIHSYAPNGKVIEHGIDAKWQRRIIGAFALRGVQ